VPGSYVGTPALFLALIDPTSWEESLRSSD
jgi:hypothetical protein